jgi:DNA-binding response OmpR family regulator
MKWRILVVDDEARYCELLRRALERDGYDAVVTSDSGLAMERLLSSRVDLLITDLDMPGLTGFDLAELARSLARPPQILLITAQKSMLAEGGKRLRDVHCLLKPFTLEDFRAKIALMTGYWPSMPEAKPSAHEGHEEVPSRI